MSKHRYKNMYINTDSIVYIHADIPTNIHNNIHIYIRISIPIHII